MYVATTVSYWISIALAPVAADFLVRVFIIHMIAVTGPSSDRGV
jgi:hypothetical protein